MNDMSYRPEAAVSAPKEHWGKSHVFVSMNPSLSLGARALYSALTGYANKDGKCWPSVKTLMEVMGAQRAAVSRWIGELREAGAITVRRGRNAGNIYYLPSSSLGTESDESVSSRRDIEESVSSRRVTQCLRGESLYKRKNRSIEQIYKGANENDSPQEIPDDLPKVVQEADTSCGREIVHPDKTGPSPAPSSQEGGSLAREELFEQFWVAYPKKRNLIEARKQWDHLISNGIDPRYLVDCARHAKNEVVRERERTGKEPSFIDFPGNFLRNREFECYGDHTTVITRLEHFEKCWAVKYGAIR